MQYLFYILLIPFLYLNYKIVFSDLKYKKIPNKYLGFLLLLIPLYYIYIYVTFPEINYLLFIGQILLTFIISFILYSFGIWSAGDAKYLLVLSLFIPYIGIIPFIGNIALLTIVYLLGYFIWFYLGKCLLYKGYAKSLWGNIKQDLNEKWITYKGNKGGKTFFIVLKWIVIFLIVFVSIRLSRFYLFNKIFSGDSSGVNFTQTLIEKYNIYLIFLGIGIFIALLYIFKRLINKIKVYIGFKLNLNTTLVGNIFISILFILLTSFIAFEFLIDSNKISNLLFKIFTLYISIYIIFKILFYSYKITFQISEQDYIDIKELKKGDIIDKEYLIKTFGEQEILGFTHKNSDKESAKERKKYLLYPNPKKFFSEISNPIDKKTLNILKKSYLITNKYHEKEQKGGFEKITQIKILKTFSFGGYIFAGFIITFIISNKIFIYFIDIIINFVKQIYN